MIKISYIVPVYNVEKYLKECIDSILKQDLFPREIILINDGSTDNSLEIINEYVKNYSDIIVINQENIGLGATRNVGIKKAQGEYIYFLDSDDYLYDTSIKNLYELSHKNDLDIIFGDMLEKWEYSKISGKEFKIKHKKTPLLNKIITNFEYLDYSVNNKIFWSASSKLIKRSILIENEIFFPENVTAEDTVFFVKSILCNNKKLRIMATNIDIFVYRKREQSITSSNQISFFENYFKIIHLIFDYKDKLPLEYSVNFNINLLIFNLYLSATTIYKKYLTTQERKEHKIFFDNNIFKFMWKYSKYIHHGRRRLIRFYIRFKLNLF